MEINLKLLKGVHTMDVRNNTNGSILPRQPNGDRNNSVQQANQQLNQAFSGSRSHNSNSPFKGGSSLLQLIINLILQLISQLAQKKPSGDKKIPGDPGDKKPPVDKDPSPIRAVYGAAIAFPRDHGDEGVRGVYGGAIAFAGPATKDKSSQ